ncbi:MAG TPA: DUF2520 domain-containing protein [Saprospiraceae bacterium]|nr:DUF2520 domain-containing protein [Saprospiraceae bacterium]HPN70305.1 DUF2520 domain-containing protein [Saprospiraceae bacterium]
MIVAIVGSGNVGSGFYEIFSTAAPINKVYWYSRNPEKGQLILDHHIPAEVDIVLLAIPDGEIDKLASQLKIRSNKTIIAHVSGATPSSVLKKYFSNFGVFYPVQTIRKKAMIDWEEVPICIYGNENSLDKLLKLGTAISKKATFLDDESRLYLHLGAVMVNNFTNHLAVLTRDFLENKQVEFALLNALIKESAKKLTQDHPDFTQTGPAIRRDFETLARHQTLLKHDDALLKLYMSMTESITNYYYKEEQ